MDCKHQDRLKCYFRTKGIKCKLQECQHDKEFRDVHGEVLKVGDNITKITQKYGKATRKGYVVYTDDRGQCMFITHLYREYKLCPVQPFHSPLNDEHKYRKTRGF